MSKEHQKLPLARATTWIDIERIDIETNTGGEIVKIHSSDGTAYRVEGRMERLAREAHRLALNGHVPIEPQPGYLADVLHAFIDVAGGPSAPKAPDKQTNVLASIAAELAETIANGFSDHLEAALGEILADRREQVLRQACATMLQ